MKQTLKTTFLIIIVVIILFCLNVGCKNNSIEGDFDTKKALELVYGKLTHKDGKYTEPAIWKDKKLKRYFYDTIVGEVYTIFDASYKENNIDKHIVITKIKPLGAEEYWGAHARGSPIGYIIFKKSNKKWVIKNENKIFIELGSFGEPPKKINLIKIGPGKFGIQFTGYGMHQGWQSIYILLFTFYKDELKIILEIGTENFCNPYSTFKKITEPKPDIKLKFIEGGNSEFYEIEAFFRTIGRKEKNVICIDEIKQFKFVEDKYIEHTKSKKVTTIGYTNY